MTNRGREREKERDREGERYSERERNKNNHLTTIVRYNTSITSLINYIVKYILLNIEITCILFDILKKDLT